MLKIENRTQPAEGAPGSRREKSEEQRGGEGGRVDGRRSYLEAQVEPVSPPTETLLSRSPLLPRPIAGAIELSVSLCLGC